VKETPSFKTRIHNIPCGVVIDHFYLGDSYPYAGAVPFESTEISFHIIDRKGYRAEWLEAFLTPEEEDRIQVEAITNYTRQALDDHHTS